MNWIKLKKRLSKISKFLDFYDLPGENALRVFHFNSDISIAINNISQTNTLNYSCRIHIKDIAGKLVVNEYFVSEEETQLFNEIAVTLSEYVDPRKFQIKKYRHGEYQLLDPDGYDHIGEFVTLKDAKRTSGYNYVLDF